MNSIETTSIIGNAKNAGKTTVLNAFIYEWESKNEKPLTITSIGINGEDFDNITSEQKPNIIFNKKHFYITTKDALKSEVGCFQILQQFRPPLFKKTYLLIRPIMNFKALLEGPNTAFEILQIKKQIDLSSEHLLIDGSIDRIFLGSPEISNNIHLALRASNDDSKTAFPTSLLENIKIKNITKVDNYFIKVFDENKMIYSSSESFLRSKSQIHEFKKKKYSIFIKGHLTQEDLNQLANDFSSVILDSEIELLRFKKLPKNIYVNTTLLKGVYKNPSFGELSSISNDYIDLFKGGKVEI